MLRKYPLELLKRVRATKVDVTSRALSVAQRRVASVEGEVARRMQARDELERGLTRTSDAELGHLERGELCARDLQHGASWRIGADLQRASHAASVEEASSLLAGAKSQQEEKRQALAHSQMDADLVEKHHEKWQHARQAEAAAKDDESADETHLFGWRGRADR